MDMTLIGEDICIPEKYWIPENKELFPTSLLKIIKNLHKTFEPRRQALLQGRVKRQHEYDMGKLPGFLDTDSEAVRGDWQVAALPPELLCRRVEITGPVNSAKMVINMLNRNEFGARADMAMLDFEDSMKPSFDNVLDGYKNVIGAVKGTLSFKNGDKTYKLNPDDMAYVMVRTRGLHLSESNLLIDGFPIAAGIVDLAVCFFHTAEIHRSRGKTPKYYIPKCEHYLEARWWNDLFYALEDSLGVGRGFLRATFLIETLPAAFQVEEILFEIRDHAAGLNVGRWDKIFSDIKVLRNHPDRILADRSTINMTCPWMENYAKRVIQICHKRGAFAMGGMSAFTPGKTETQREQQTQKVLEDKRKEASWGHDGCWVSHPYFIGVAMQAFQTENQLSRMLEEFDKYADLLPEAKGPHTLAGLRTNIRVGIAYMHGWRQDLGCVAFENLMEDLATLEISRAQTWQWLHHGLTLDDGTKVTPDLVKKLFYQECQNIVREADSSQRSEIEEAAQEAAEIFLEPDLREFFDMNQEVYI